MEKENNSSKNKVKLLVLYDILRKNSDSSTPLKTNEIIKLLAEKGIRCGRKSLYDDIKTLNEYGFNVEVERKQQLEIYVDHDDFEESELRVLVDAIQAASFIPIDTTEKFKGKVAALAGINKGEVLKRNITCLNHKKTTNKQIFYVVDEISNAIQNRKNITYNYIDYMPDGSEILRKNGDLYVLSPVDLVIESDNYYVLGTMPTSNDVYSYRVDRMRNVTMTEDDFDIDDSVINKVKEYKDLSFSMYSNEPISISLNYNEKYANYIYEKFGNDIKSRKLKDGLYTITVRVAPSPPFYAWLTTFEGEITIAAPKKIVEEYKKRLENSLKALEQYL